MRAQRLEILPRRPKVVNPSIGVLTPRYWTALPPTLETMLGGFQDTRLPRVDILGSRTFLAHTAIKKRLQAGGYSRAVDCGAGIGRVTKELLSTIFSVTDVVEPVEAFSAQVREGEYLRAEREAGKVGDVYTMGLQEFQPEKERYSVIWNQWCLGHIRDDDLVGYFKRCKQALVPRGGVIIVKENTCVGEDIWDAVDSSCTRTDKSWRRIFATAGLTVIHSAQQYGTHAHE
jgi:protein N-terminal methyltransferase